MDPEDALKVIAIDAWYKALMYAGAIAFALSLLWEIKGNGLTNQQLQLLAGGCFLIGLGEWKNHKVVSRIKPPNAYTGGPALMSGKVRQPDFFGVVFVFTGVCLIIIAIIKIMRG